REASRMRRWAAPSSGDSLWLPSAPCSLCLSCTACCARSPRKTRTASSKKKLTKDCRSPGGSRIYECVRSQVVACSTPTQALAAGQEAGDLWKPDLADRRRVAAFVAAAVSSRLYSAQESPEGSGSGGGARTSFLADGECGARAPIAAHLHH